MTGKQRRTNSSMAIRYAVMSLAVSTVSSSVIFGHLSYYSSYDRIAVLAILFNVIAVMSRAIVSVFADKVQNKHTGVRLGVLLTIMGLYYPVDFGINAKVILLAIGSCIFHSFASSSLLSRSKGKGRDIGFFLAGSALGTALSTFSHFFGYVMAALLVIFAIPDDDYQDIASNEPEIENDSIKLGQRFIFVPLLMLAYTCIYFILSSLHFSWNVWFKTECLIFAALAVGRALGGVISDLIGKTMTVTAGVGGGALLLLFCSDNKILSLIGLALVSAALSPTVTLCHRYLPKNPGFVFALLSAAAYFGQSLTMFIKLKGATLLLVGAFVIALFFSSEVRFLIKSIVVKEENDDE